MSRRKTMGELASEYGYDFDVNPRMAVSTWAKRIGIPSLGKLYDKVESKLAAQSMPPKKPKTEVEE